MRVSELPRPSPERLLKPVQAEENKRWGAKLKIFLGYTPGVGKSYRMLDEARRRHERGEDVIVGAVQSRQSEEVQALLQKLEMTRSLETPEGQAIDIELFSAAHLKSALLTLSPRIILLEAVILPAGRMCRSCCETGFPS